MNKFLIGLIAVFAAALVACSDETSATAKKAPAKAAEPVTGQSALFRMYQVARLWAPDAEVLDMDSIRLTEVPDVAGKSGAWQATFVSRSKSRSKSYTYSVIEGEGTLHEGVFGGQEQDWSPGQSKTDAFLIGAVKTDTDAALKMAQTNGGYDYEKGKPKQVISFQLEKLPKYANPSWRVIWGESAGTSNFSIYIDATQDEFLGRMH